MSKPINGSVGGALVGKDGSTGKTVLHEDGSQGGIFIGRTHAENGIKGVNTSTNTPIEVETREALIIPKAVNNKKIHDFEGQKLTTRQVLSRINQSGGGVAFAYGGTIPKTIKTTGKMYRMGGKMESDHDIVMRLGGKNVEDHTTETPIQVPGGAVVITKGAVADPTKREFNGKQMTNKEILSEINSASGGMSFADGGAVNADEKPHGCGCSHQMNTSYFVEGGDLKKMSTQHIKEKISLEDFRKAYPNIYHVKRVKDPDYFQLIIKKRVVENNTQRFSFEIYKSYEKTPYKALQDIYTQYMTGVKTFSEGGQIDEDKVRHAENVLHRTEVPMFFRHMQKHKPRQLIKMIADQYHGRGESGHKYSDDKADLTRASIRRQFSDELVNAAIEAYPEDSYMDGGTIVKSIVKMPKFSSDDIFIMNAVYQNRLIAARASIAHYDSTAGREYLSEVNMSQAAAKSMYQDKIEKIKDDIAFLNKNKYPFDIVSDEIDFQVFGYDLNELVKTNIGRSMFDDNESLYQSYLKLYDKLETYYYKKYPNSFFKDGGQVDSKKKSESGIHKILNDWVYAEGGRMPEMSDIKSVRKYQDSTIKDRYNFQTNQQEYGYEVKFNNGVVWYVNAPDKEEAKKIALERIASKWEMFNKEKSSSAETFDDEKPLKLSDIPTEVKLFMPEIQQKAIVGTTELRPVLKRLEDIITRMPKTYETENTPAKDKIVYLHYFYGNSDWYIVEKDAGSPDDIPEDKGKQYQAFGYTILNGDVYNAEWGYISIEEIKATRKIELDFYFEPVRFETIREELEKSMEEDRNAEFDIDEPVVAGPGEQVINGKLYLVPQPHNPNLIAPKKIKLTNSNGETVYETPKEHQGGGLEFRFADQALREILDKRLYSDIYYTITYDDGYELYGSIDLEPISFWKDKGSPLTGHLSYFWKKMSEASALNNEYYAESIAEAKNLVDHYELREYMMAPAIIKQAEPLSVSKEQVKMDISQWESKDYGTGMFAMYAVMAPGFYNTMFAFHASSIEEAVALKKSYARHHNMLPSDFLVKSLQDEDQLKKLRIHFEDKYLDDYEKRTKNIKPTKEAPTEIIELNEEDLNKQAKLSSEKYQEEPFVNKPQSLLAKYASSKQSEINNEIRRITKEKGIYRSNYSQDELAFIKLYEGAGSLAKEGETGARLLDQFFTPVTIVSKMWGLAVKYGFKFNGARILEPAVGSGRFLHAIPQEEIDTNVIAYDVDETCYTICKVLFPSFDIRLGSFESMFFRNKRHVGLAGVNEPFDLVIGNPPYREYVSEYAPLGEKSATGAFTFEMYFIMRGIDVLKPGGLLVFIIPNTFMSNDNKYNDFKEKLAEKCNLLEAYRLPNGVFGNTDVGTDIIVLQKK